MTAEEGFRGDNLPVKFDYDVVQNHPELIGVLNCLPESINKVGISRPKEKEIRNFINSIKRSHCQYLKNKSFLNCVKETICNNGSKPSTLVKEITDIMLKEELASYSLNYDEPCDPNHDGATFFGLSVDCIGRSGIAFQNNSPLIVEKKDIVSRSFEVRDRSMESKSQIIQGPSSGICKEKLGVLNWNAELQEIMKQYYKVLSNCMICLEAATNVMLNFKEEIELKMLKLLKKKIELSKTNRDVEMTTQDLERALNQRFFSLMESNMSQAHS